MASKIFHIGVAGWTIPGENRNEFPSEGSHLERYSQIFNCVEINSSFHREHQFNTYLRWSETVPKDFRFSVKLSKIFTHENKLKVNSRELHLCLDNYQGLGENLGILLVQLPPKLEFELKIAETFFIQLRKSISQAIVLEPRHISWRNADAYKLMLDLGISKVRSDPEPCPGGEVVSSAADLSYFRYHGSPMIYRSSYSAKALQELAKEMNQHQASWCIFDNTTLGAAVGNALDLKKLLSCP